MPVGYVIEGERVFRDGSVGGFDLKEISPILPAAPAQAPETTARLQYHKMVLEAAGITDLSTLGRLAIEGTVVPCVGLTVPAEEIYEPNLTIFQSARRVNLLGTALEGISGTARIVKATALSTTIVPAFPLRASSGAVRLNPPAPGPKIPTDMAYWVATEIDLADNVTIVLKHPNKFLCIIAEKITTGESVTITWERPEKYAPPTPDQPEKQPQAPTPDGLWGVDGEPGTDGQPGGDSPPGDPGPEIEMWTLEMTGKPKFDVSGQKGVQGGEGQDGGNGGDGSTGRDAIVEVYAFGLSICRSGPGSGGNGGRGGAAGNGGRGGNGGHGGRVKLFAPQAVLNTYASGFLADVGGGSGGSGGMPGVPGQGGAGGQVGANPKNCASSSPRTAGSAGAQGAKGEQGKMGDDGEEYEHAIDLEPIDADDFKTKLLAPALIRLTPQDAYQGDMITAMGLRFSAGDVVLVQGVPCSTRIIDDKTLTFVVPAVEGGRLEVTVKQSDGTLSNSATLNLLPLITPRPRPDERIRPGTMVTLQGSGFAAGSRVWANGQDMPGVRFVNSNTVEFLLQRPAVIAANPMGESVTLQVELPLGDRSNEITVVLDTYRILVLGDSVMWGQGLRTNQKMHSLVADALRQQMGNIGMYVENLAHSGATIGRGDPNRFPALDGEVPTSYPTISQQCDDYNNSPESIDLIIVNGGINDINVRRILNLGIAEIDLQALIEQYCHQDMAELLGRMARKFTQARIIVTGYYPMLSEDSNLALVDAFLIALGFTVAEVAGGIAGGVAGLVLLEALAKRCRFWAEQSEIKLQQAIDEANHALINDQSEPARRVFLAQPEFATENAALAPDAWIFGINLNLSPEDSLVAPGRWTACQSAGATRTDVEVCIRASVGHPNQFGAQAYFREIMAQLSDQTFPAGFLWGVATAGYQVEGGITNNDWHTFTTNPTIVSRVHTLPQIAGLDINLIPPGDAIRHGDLAVLIEDLERARLLGMNAYRFSIEWSRVQPTRFGAFDLAALQYYEDAIDNMLQRGLKPIVTLNHLTLPAWVLTPPESILDPAHDTGFTQSLRGWENSATVDWFITFVNYVVGRLAYRVDTWITLNEPVGSMIGVGYIAGVWPPGFIGYGSAAKTAYFNLLRAHVLAYDAIKSIYSGRPSHVGIAHSMMFARLTNAGGGIGNVNAAARNQFSYFYNEHLLNSLVNDQVDTAIRRRPVDRVNVPSQQFYGLPPSQPWTPRLDFIGLNYYRSVYVYYDESVATLADFSGGKFDPKLSDDGEDNNLVNDLGWEIYPHGLYHMLATLHQSYGLPILITENGMPQSTDRNRAPYIVAHLQEVLRALRDGVRVEGYIHWTIADNFEWQENYRPQARFGLFTVDRDATDASGNKTLPRHITEGALALQYVATENGLGQAVEKFGAITPRAFAVTPPAKSAGATWEGATSDGVGLSLYLSRLASGVGFLGMIFFQDTHRWHRLENIQWDGAVLRFAYRLRNGDQITGEGRPAGHDMAGTLNGYPVPRQWRASRLSLCGTWYRDTGVFPPFIHVARLEGGFDQWRSKFLAAYPRQSWESHHEVDWDGTTLTLDMQGVGTFEGSLNPARDTLAGTLNLIGAGGIIAPTVWSARRLPDDVPFT